MKHITIILLLSIIGCNSLPKTENEIDKTVYKMWENFTNANPEFNTGELPDSNPFHNNEYDANRLAELIVIGEKKAGSNLYYWYEEANAELPKIGTKTIVTDFGGKAKAIIQIIKVDTIPFSQISREYAELDMGTKIEPLKKWRKAHWDFFSQALKGSQKQPTKDMLVVCEWFETIWPEK